MINEFVKQYSDIVKFIKGHKVYIRAEASKQRLIGLYEKYWLPYSEGFKNSFGKTDHDTIENVLNKIFLMCKKDFIVKSQILLLLRKIEPVIDNIKINQIRCYGFIVDKNQKETIVDLLKSNDFKGTLSYLQDAENDFKNGKSKPTCSNVRLAMDEFFREFREKLFKKTITGVTATEHIAAINNKIKIPTSEQSLLKNGIYLFLSHKGGHGTTDRPTPEDARLSIDLIYSCIGYVMNKYAKYIVKGAQNPFNQFNLEALLASPKK